MFLKSFIPISLALSVVLPTGGSVSPKMVERKAPAFLAPADQWADSILLNMPLEQKVAQLMMVAAWSNKGADHQAYIERLCRERNIGGLIFFQGGPARQAALTNRYQAAAPTPLLIGMDLEWGFDMRLDSTFRFPRQMTLGALPDDGLIKQMGLEIAAQMNRLGVHVSFSPVADVNNNPNNPVINERSFGEDRERVAAKAISYMEGLQQGGVIATGKHFPGHGDTDKDSHKTLPLITHDTLRLDSIELYPFKRLIGSGIQAMMVAHLEIPALDSAADTPTTLSPKVVNGLLRDRLGFNGLIFTDAMNMRGVADVGQPGDLELRALKAGNDILLFPQDPEKAIDRIVQEVKAGNLDQALIDRKCKKVLRAKRWVKLNEWKPIELAHVQADMNPPSAKAVRQQIFNEAVTVLKNEENLLPLFATNKKRFSVVTIGAGKGDIFKDEVLSNVGANVVRVSSKPSEADILAAVRKTAESDVVIVGIHGTSRSPKSKFGVSDMSMKLIRSLNDRKEIIVVHFGNPYRLDQRSGMAKTNALLVAYEDVPEAHIAASKLIFGSLSTKATLPVTISDDHQVGDGISALVPTRMLRSSPESQDLNAAVFAQVDSIVQDGMDKGAYPGCQVLVVKNGNIVFEKAYGKPIYKGDRKVNLNDVYDLASITKVASTTLSLMRLYDEGKFDPDKRLGEYLPELIPDTSAYFNLKPREMLAHQAGLRSWIPFYWKMLKDGKRKEKLFSDTQNKVDDVEIADHVFIPKVYQDSIMPWILKTPLRTKRNYKYSDLGYYFLNLLIEKQSGMPQEEYVQKVFYRPMGLRNIGYHPSEWTDKRNIIPTEYDAVWRGKLVHGSVHDPGAAMLGGVGGHAGLFSNAEDLAVIMQMLLNGGEYGGNRFIEAQTIAEFTKCQFCDGSKKENRRAMGFDKPFRHGEGGPTFYGIPLETFGHSGFTGTLAWADPENNLVYVFLSNRVYPSADNKKLLRMDIRTKIQEAIYSGIIKEIEIDPSLLAGEAEVAPSDAPESEAVTAKELRRRKREEKRASKRLQTE